MVEYKHGGLGLVLSSRDAPRWSEQVTIYAEGITLNLKMFRELRCIHDSEEFVYRADSGSGWQSHLEARGFVDEIQHFFDCIGHRQEHKQYS